MSSPSTAPKGIVDWAAVEARLAKAQSALDEALVITPEQARTIMDARVTQLAQVAAAGQDTSEALEVASFTLAFHALASTVGPCALLRTTVRGRIALRFSTQSMRAQSRLVFTREPLFRSR